jgi:hypothetical protein
MDTQNSATAGYDQIKTEAHPRVEADVIAVYGVVSRIVECLSMALRTMKVHTIICGLDTGSDLNEISKRFYDTISREKQTSEEKKRPIVFVADSFGGDIVHKALQRSRRWNPEAMFDSTSGIFLLDTGPTTMWVRKGEISRFLDTPIDHYKEHWLSKLMRPGRGVRSLCELCLPLGQVICIIPMNTFKPTNELRNLYPTTDICSRMVSKTCEAIMKHLKSTLLSAKSVAASLGFNTWLVGLTSRSTLTPEMLTYTKKQETGYEIELPLFLTEPGPVVFVYASMMYSIFVMVYYILHHHHRYQHAFISLGITAGAIFSFWFQPQNGAIGAITTIMPILLSFALGFSNGMHSLVGPRSYIEEEKIFRALDLWASEIANVNTSAVDEKDNREKNCFSHSVSV